MKHTRTDHGAAITLPFIAFFWIVSVGLTSGMAGGLLYGSGLMTKAIAKLTTGGLVSLWTIFLCYVLYRYPLAHYDETAPAAK